MADNMKQAAGIITAGLVVAGVTLGGLAASHADHTNGFGDWQPIPAHMVGDTCDTIDGGSPTVVLGEHALYSDVDGTRFVITMPGRICSS